MVGAGEKPSCRWSSVCSSPFPWGCAARTSSSCRSSFRRLPPCRVARHRGSSAPCGRASGPRSVSDSPRWLPPGKNEPLTGWSRRESRTSSPRFQHVDITRVRPHARSCKWFVRTLVGEGVGATSQRFESRPTGTRVPPQRRRGGLWRGSRISERNEHEAVSSAYAGSRPRFRSGWLRDEGDRRKPAKAASSEKKKKKKDEKEDKPTASSPPRCGHSLPSRFARQARTGRVATPPPPWSAGFTPGDAVASTGCDHAAAVIVDMRACSPTSSVICCSRFDATTRRSPPRSSGTSTCRPRGQCESKAHPVGQTWARRDPFDPPATLLRAALASKKGGAA